MVVSKRAILTLLVTLGLMVVSHSANASLTTRWDFACELAESAVDTMLSDSFDELSEAGGTTRDDKEDERESAPRQQLINLSKIQQHHGSSSATSTSSSTDGCSQAPVFTDQNLLLPSHLDAGGVIGFKAMIPPDPPPLGLIKPPRNQI